MTAKDILSHNNPDLLSTPAKSVDSDMPLFDVLPRLLDSPQRVLGVTDGDRRLGIIDSDSMLEGLGSLIAARDDSSEISLECSPAEYSASSIARAVEDTDAHLVDLLTRPGDDGMIRVTMRIRHNDPSAAVHSLERYGYNVTEAHGKANGDISLAAERLLELRALLNV